MKKTIFLLIVSLMLTQLCFATPSVKDGLDILRYKELQILAVDQDVLLPLGWSENDKKSIKMAADEGISELKTLKKYLNELELPKELNIIRDYHLGFIDRMASLYAGLDKKSDDQIEKEYAEIRKYTETHHKEVNSFYVKYLETEKVPANFDPTNEEARFAKSSQDSQVYIAAVKLIQERKYEEAQAILAKLEPKYKKTVFGTCILLRVSDCLISDDGGGDVLKGEKILEEIVNFKKYTPILFEAFEKWRSVTQANNYGMSNMSAIPNDMYNKKRWELVQVIKNYLTKNPEDFWARAQVNFILALPNVNRGTPYGNENLVNYARLYSDILDKENNAGLSKGIQPAGEAEINEVLSLLNKQGVIITFGDNIKNNKLSSYNADYGSFILEGESSSWHYLYKSDIDNDGNLEYIVTGAGGSGAFYDIEHIFRRTQKGNFEDIFDQIKLPMRRLIRDAEKETYDLEEGYVGFMGGSLVIENKDGVTYFSMVDRSGEAPKIYKFLWDKSGLRLI